MAVAAYAALLSLADVLDRVQHASMHRLHLDRKQIEALQDKVSSLRDFLELDYSQRMSEEIIVLQGLMRQITNVAGEAEHIADSHVVGQIRKGFPDDSDAITLFCKNIERIIETIDSITGKLMGFKGIMGIEQKQPAVSVHAVLAASPSRSPSIGRNTMVGFDEQLDIIMDELMGYKSDLQILPIVGMGGIGKTTLAKHVFDHPYVVHHYDIRLWVIISQEYTVREILLRLLQEPGDLKSKKSGDTLAQLGERLYKTLFDRRYLIVIDDVWSSKFWEDLRMFFPDNKNGSRMMVTTRQTNVGVSFGSNNPFLMNFLNEDQSWNLLCEKAFKEKGCPPELEKVGKTIARGCKGLPLAIVVIGGLLSKSNMTLGYWEYVAENLNTFVNSGYDDHCLKVLSLSYSHLPIHLKPCFLFMRFYDEDEKIDLLRIINKWVVEGFIKAMKDKTLEETAEEYLKDLIDRNLILILNRTRRGRIKHCGVHDLLRDLCIREFSKEHFYCVPRMQVASIAGFGRCILCVIETSERRYFGQVVTASQPKSLVGCLVCQDCETMYRQLNRLMLVNLTDRVGDILHPTTLRFLVISGDLDSVSNLSLLWNLHTIVTLSDDQVLPSQVWEMSQLRTLEVEAAIFPICTQNSTIILENLHTVDGIKDFNWSEDAIKRMPNLKRLRIIYYDCEGDWSCYSLHNLSRLDKLEALDLEAHLLTLRNIAFPHSLKKLNLRCCHILWEEMTIIGSLPNLEVLRLYSKAFKGLNWNPIEGEFLRLQSLFIRESNLKCWRVEKSQFPNLEHLKLQDMKYLEEIPSEIGEIETLRSITLNDCLEAVVNSAKGILEEQHSFGNEDFQLYVNYKLVMPDFKTKIHHD